eukprot:gene11233-7987_t
MGNEVTHNIHHIVHDEYDPHFCTFLHPKLVACFHKLETSEDFKAAFLDYFFSGAWSLNHFKCPRVVLSSISYVLPTHDTLTISEDASHSLYVTDKQDVNVTAWKHRSPLAKAMLNFEGLLPLMIANALMQYIVSPQYVHWVKSKGLSTLGEKIRRNSSFMLHPLRASAMLTHFLHEDHHTAELTLHHTNELDDMVLGLQKEFTMPRIASYVESKVPSLRDQKDDLLKSLNMSTLRNALEYLDNFPVSLAISSSRPHHHCPFPFVFVNKAFETLTQYKREEVIGHSWAFMQSEEHTEMNQDHCIRDSLREQLPVRLVITNIRKDGTPFTNLLALEPIVSHSPQTYIIGVQYELSGNEKNLKYDLQVVEDVVKLLSGILAC